jgi:hypothetical protein
LHAHALHVTSPWSGQLAASEGAAGAGAVSDGQVVLQSPEAQKEKQAVPGAGGGAVLSHLYVDVIAWTQPTSARFVTFTFWPTHFVQLPLQALS